MASGGVSLRKSLCGFAGLGETMLVLNAFLRGLFVAIVVSFLWALTAELTQWRWMSALIPVVFIGVTVVGAATVIGDKR